MSNDGLWKLKIGSERACMHYCLMRWLCTKWLLNSEMGKIREFNRCLFSLGNDVVLINSYRDQNAKNFMDK